MTAVERDRHAAAQAKADAVIRAVAEPMTSAAPRLRVSVTDVDTGQRLATGFVTYEPVEQSATVRHLSLVGD